MNQTQLIHSAKQRDTDAITTLLNQSLSSRRIAIAEATIEEECLSLKLQARRIPDQHKIIPFLTEELKTLGIQSIEQVTVYGLAEESANPAWEKTITLTKDCSISSFVTKIDAKRTFSGDSSENEGEENLTANAFLGQETDENTAEENNTLENSSESSEDAELDRTFAEQYAKAGSSSSLVPLVLSLAVGFGIGMATGMFFGYQKAISERGATTGAIQQPR